MIGCLAGVKTVAGAELFFKLLAGGWAGVAIFFRGERELFQPALSDKSPESDALIQGCGRNSHADTEWLIMAPHDLQCHITDGATPVQNPGVHIISEHDPLHTSTVPFATAHSGRRVPLHVLASAQYVMYRVEDGGFAATVVT